MKIILLLLTLLALTLDSSGVSSDLLTSVDSDFNDLPLVNVPPRKIGWFTNRLLLAYNQQFVTAHQDIVQKLYPCCMAFFITDDGKLYKNDDDQFINWYTTTYRSMGIEVHPVITAHNSMGMAYAYNNTHLIALQLYEHSQKFNFSGYVFDYEGNAQDSVLYAKFLDEIATYFHKQAVPIILSTTIASWGALSNYSAYANTSVDNFIQMGTYSPPFIPALIDDVVAVIPPPKVEMGLSTFHAAPTYTWSCPQLQQAVAYARLRGIERIGVWWCPNSPSDGDIQPFFLTQLSAFASIMC